jgi:hypothetical protein
MSGRRARFTKSDIARILKAATEAGVEICVRITPDGSITIATGTPGELNGDGANPWDEALNAKTE